MQKKTVLIQAEEDFIPIYSSEEAAGADLKAAIKEPILLNPGKRVLIPTGIKMEIPKGFEVQVRPRSGLAVKNGISVVNTPGTIDSDYRGEIKVILVNLGEEPFEILPKMRIAQAVLAPVIQAEFSVVKELCTTSRGEGGFGHTGIN